MKRNGDHFKSWPDAVGICCQCFNPIQEGELYKVRENGRNFYKHCFEQGGYYVELETKKTQREG